MSSENSGITITFCDRAENHVGNQQIGALAEEGFTYKDLSKIEHLLDKSGVESELIDLGEYLPEEHQVDAGLLIIRNGSDIFTESSKMIWKELSSLDYDKKAFMYGKVVNKNARHNLCFGDFDQEPDYEKKMGRVISFQHLPVLNHVRTYLPKLVGKKGTNLMAEANYYYDINKCGIGYHGDAERKVVIGLRLGASFPLTYYWYLQGKRISERIDFNLNEGDMYIMSEKTCGYDWKKKKIVTLRHAAGCNEYIVPKE